MFYVDIRISKKLFRVYLRKDSDDFLFCAEVSAVTSQSGYLNQVTLEN